MMFCITHWWIEEVIILQRCNPLFRTVVHHILAFYRRKKIYISCTCILTHLLLLVDIGAKMEHYEINKYVNYFDWAAHQINLTTEISHCGIQHPKITGNKNHVWSCSEKWSGVFLLFLFERNCIIITNFHSDNQTS